MAVTGPAEGTLSVSVRPGGRRTTAISHYDVVWPAGR